MMAVDVGSVVYCFVNKYNERSNELVDDSAMSVFATCVLVAGIVKLCYIALFLSHFSLSVRLSVKRVYCDKTK